MGSAIQKHFGISTVEEVNALGQIAAADPVKLQNLQRLIPRLKWQNRL